MVLFLIRTGWPGLFKSMLLFADRFSLNEWSLQPSINIRNGHLENMGQFYVVKFPVTRDKAWSLFTYFGMQELFGVTWNFRDTKNVTVSGGVIVNSLSAANISESQKAYTVNLRWSAGVFYDDRNSLLVSLVATGAAHNRFRLNVYPGVFRIGPMSPGIFIDNTGSWAAGFSIRFCPVGVSVGTSTD